MDQIASERRVDSRLTDKINKAALHSRQKSKTPAKKNKISFKKN